MTLQIMPNRSLLRLGWSTKMVDIPHKWAEGDVDPNANEPYFMYSIDNTDWMMENEAWKVSRERVENPPLKIGTYPPQTRDENIDGPQGENVLTEQSPHGSEERFPPPARGYPPRR